jgi:hypothetical protein
MTINEFNETYIHKAKLDLDIVELKKYCLQIEPLIEKKWKTYLTEDNKLLYQNTSVTLKLFNYYNLLEFPHPELHKLYFYLQHVFKIAKRPEHNQNYYVSMWMNIHKKGEFIDWHNHEYADDCGYHGWFSVSAEPSITSYKLKTGYLIDVVNENNQLVVSRSDGDFHKVSVWEEEYERITLGFNISPNLGKFYCVDEGHKLVKNWIPL